MHTPAPWNVIRHATHDYAPQFGIYAEGSSRDLATVTSVEADALLIAAAPALLAALAGLLDTMETPRTREASAAWVVAHAAIADATVSA